MFHQLAEFYDPLVDAMGYDARSESARLERLTRKYGRSGGRDWLDVACGTGRHLVYLRGRYAVTGVDLSPEMLRIARRRLPGIRLIRADMRRFRLGRTFDVISCLFSAIGHLRSEEEIRQSFQNFARHLKPGGLVIVEPWIHPANFRPGRAFLVTVQRPSKDPPDRCIARLSYSRRRGFRSEIETHYLVAARGRPVRHYSETSVGLLLAPRTLVRLLRKAGLRPTYLPIGLRAGRGLLIGIREPSTP